MFVDDRKFYVYKITNLVNNKIYIGKTNNIKIRWQNHKYSAGLDSKFYFQKALSKYGFDNFKIEIITGFLEEKESFLAEEEYIDLYKSNINQYGYNLTKGGEGSSGWIMPEETKRKISEKAKGRLVSEETREKISIVRFGKTHSETSKNKIGKSNSGKKRNKEFGLAVSKRCKGKIISEETKLKQSVSHLGKGSSLSENDVLNIREKFNSGSLSKRQLSTLYNITFQSVSQIIQRKTWKHI